MTILIVLVGCGALGVVIERVGLRPLAGTARIAPLLATIGIGLVLDQLMQILGSPDPRSLQSALPKLGLADRRRHHRGTRHPDRRHWPDQRHSIVLLPSLQQAWLGGAHHGAGP